MVVVNSPVWLMCVFLPKFVVKIVSVAHNKRSLIVWKIWYFSLDLLVLFHFVVSWLCWYNCWAYYWSETLFLINNVFCRKAAMLRSPSVLWWRSGVMKDNADNWSFVWRTSSPKYHSGKVSSQLLVLSHPPLGDLVFSSRDVLSVFTKPSASRKPSLKCFRCSFFSFSFTSLIYLSRNLSRWLSQDTSDWKL